MTNKYLKILEIMYVVAHTVTFIASIFFACVGNYFLAIYRILVSYVLLKALRD